jgi:hypothetical protein
MAHYMVDCFYRDPGGRVEPIPRERKRIVAYDDNDAIKQANGMPVKPKPAFFEVRTATRKNRLVYTSPVSDAGA